MALSAFGVRHAAELGKRDHTAALGTAAALSGAGAVTAHKAKGQLKRVAPAHRISGLLAAMHEGDPAKFSSHLRGGARDVKLYVGLGHAKTALGAAAVGLGGAAALSAASRKKQ